MKLRNKKTGEIIEVLAKISFIKRNDNFINSEINTFNSLAKLNEEWEDYQEPKEYYFIRSESLTIGYSPISNTRSCRNRKAIGNYFETKEEAEKAVEKLKAWKRLCDRGICWFWIRDETRRDYPGYKIEIEAAFGEDNFEGALDDLKTLFGGSK